MHIEALDRGPIDEEHVRAINDWNRSGERDERRLNERLARCKRPARATLHDPELS